MSDRSEPLYAPPEDPDEASEVIFGFNPFDPHFREDPYPVYERLRNDDPVHRSPFGIWVLSRYQDCFDLLHHHRTSSDQRNSPTYRALLESDPDSPLVERMQGPRPFLFLDPPDHTRLRGLVSKAFTPRVVAQLEPRINELVAELFDSAKDGEMEVIQDLAYPLPVVIISEMLGVPPEDRDTFQKWSKELARSLDPDIVLPPEVIEKRRRAGEEFRAYFLELIAEKKRRPLKDLLSALINVEAEGDKLTEVELVVTCILLLIAGHETTVSLIGNGFLAFAHHPGELKRLRSDPSLARQAVEEVLRYDPPVQLTARIAMEDIEVAGTTLESGEQAILLLGSANRDPEQFPEPDRFDITREKINHIAFGAGIHFCLGAPLARLEAKVAFGELARRSEELRLLDPPTYRENIVLRGLQELRVALK